VVLAAWINSAVKEWSDEEGVFMKKNILRIMTMMIMVSACLLLSGCFITGGDHFLWF